MSGHATFVDFRSPGTGNPYANGRPNGTTVVDGLSDRPVKRDTEFRDNDSGTFQGK